MRNNESPTHLRDTWWFDKPFSVQDRTRQLVFWAVDWQAQGGKRYQYGGCVLLSPGF